MGFILSVLYLVISYFTPATVLGPLAAFHVELILAVLILFVSFPVLTRSFIFKTPQSIALIGLVFAVFMSILFGKQWATGGARAALNFIPNAVVYFFVCLHCNSVKKLKVFVLVLFSVCLFVVGHGVMDLLYGIPESGPALSAETGEVDHELWEFQHPYIFEMVNENGEFLYRVRGLGEINDPNDFAQLTVCVIPLMLIFWRKNRYFRNMAFVVLPVGVLLLGIVLTHSRGALVALTVLAIVVARRRIGTLPAVIVVGCLFVAAMALQFTGGRGISASEGEDRTALWGESMQLFKSHPLFGVGFGDLPSYIGHTAHNTVAVCAAELGLFGLFFWSLFLFSSGKDALALASSNKLGEGKPIAAEVAPYSMPTIAIEDIDKAEINRLGRLIVLSLMGFLVAGWFLSRAFVLTLFLLAGMAEAVYEMALQRGMIASRMGIVRSLPYAGGLALFLLLVLYIMIRILNLMH
jgi:hypothetical protein